MNKTGATLTIAMGDPTNVFAMDDIKFMTGYNVEPVVASEVALRKAIDRHYGTPRSVVLQGEDADVSPAPSPRPDGSLDDVMASSALTADDMAGVGLGEINMDEITGVEAGADVDVVKAARKARRSTSSTSPSRRESAPIIKLSNLILDRGAEGGRLRHPRRAVREGVPRPVPRRRHPPQHHGAADAHARPAHLAR